MSNKKILFACDLDNTLIHSHRSRSEGDICVELLEGREQSFITPRARQLTDQVQADENVMFVPVTTRSEEQYRRIQWQDSCTPELALVCNGSVLLRNGVPDPEWLRESQSMTQPFADELKRLCDLYSCRECFRTVRIVGDMFLFAYCTDGADIEKIAADCAADTELCTRYSGRKLYFFPPAADKGRAVRWLSQMLGASEIIAAGDSVIDFPMLRIADYALVPDADTAELLGDDVNSVCCGEAPFAEFILDFVLNKAK